MRRGKRKLARKFNLSYHYIDDFTSFSNKRFKGFISDIYPKELKISETTESTPVASYLDLLVTRDKSNNITTKLYDTMHLSSFVMPIVAQIIVTFFITPQGPCDKTSVTGLQTTLTLSGAPGDYID